MDLALEFIGQQACGVAKVEVHVERKIPKRSAEELRAFRREVNRGASLAMTIDGGNG